MRVGEERRVGFDLEMVREWIGLWDAGERDLETCPREAVAEVDARGCHER
jgi:hypothetical protein